MGDLKKLTKGKQREYADYIAEAKRDETKTRRLEKIVPMIGERRRAARQISKVGSVPTFLHNCREFESDEW